MQVLVLDCHLHTTTVVRSLAADDFDVVLGVTEQDLAEGFVHVSRFVGSTWTHPDIVDEPGQFGHALLRLLEKKPELKLIFPVGENSVRRMSGLRAQLPDGVVVLMPDNDTIDLCMNKPACYRIAEQNGVPVPVTRVVDTPEALEAAVNVIGLPVIAKAPDSSAFLAGKKCHIMRSWQDVEQLRDAIRDHDSAFVIQQMIEGRRYNCDIVAQSGRIERYFESEILRTDEPDYTGNSVFDRSISPTATRRAYCKRLIESLGYTGVALIQFLEDEHSGDNYFLEVNARAGSTIALAVHCGVDLPATSARAHMGEALEPAEPYPLGKSQSWLHGDLLGLRKALIENRVGAGQATIWLASAFADFVRSSCHATFVWRDPLPTSLLYWRLLTRMLGRKNRAVNSDPPGRGHVS